MQAFLFYQHRAVFHTGHFTFFFFSQNLIVLVLLLPLKITSFLFNELYTITRYFSKAVLSNEYEKKKTKQFIDSVLWSVKHGSLLIFQNLFYCVFNSLWLRFL